MAGYLRRVAIVGARPWSAPPGGLRQALTAGSVTPAPPLEPAGRPPPAPRSVAVQRPAPPEPRLLGQSEVVHTRREDAAAGIDTQRGDLRRPESVPEPPPPSRAPVVPGERETAVAFEPTRASASSGKTVTAHDPFDRWRMALRRARAPRAAPPSLTPPDIDSPPPPMDRVVPDDLHSTFRLGPPRHRSLQPDHGAEAPSASRTEVRIGSWHVTAQFSPSVPGLREGESPSRGSRLAGVAASSEPRSPSTAVEPTTIHPADQSRVPANGHGAKEPRATVSIGRMDVQVLNRPQRTARQNRSAERPQVRTVVDPVTFDRFRLLP